MTNKNQKTYCTENKSVGNTSSYVINNAIMYIKTNDICYRIKVHRELILQVLKNRELNNKYQTNKEIKFLALYYLLKNISQTSIIKNYNSNLNHILEYTNLSQGTFYNHLNKLIQLGLVTKNAHNLVVSDYNTLFELYDVEPEQTPIYINYTPNKNKFIHLLEFSTIADNIYRQNLVIEKKLEKSPYTLEILERYAKQATTIRTLAVAQKHAFINGSTELKQLFFINPNVVITWKRLFREFNFKSYKSVSYLKRKLKKNKLVMIEKNGFFTSKVGAKTTAYNEELDKTLNTYRYCKKTNKTKKQFADNWNLTPKLYDFTPYYKN